MTSTTVVIPIRGLRDGKSRLAPHLEPSQRTAVVRGMASRVITAVAASGVADATLVVSGQPDLLDDLPIGSPHVDLLVQPWDAIGLNSALDLGRDEALARNAERLLILSADLPLLTARSVREFVDMAGPAEVVVGVDRTMTGTNALLLRGHCAMSRFAFQFGLGSRRLHRQEAERIGLDPVERHLREIALDLDTPDDWALLDASTRRLLLDAQSATARTSTGHTQFVPSAQLE